MATAYCQKRKTRTLQRNLTQLVKDSHKIQKINSSNTIMVAHPTIPNTWVERTIV